MDALIEAALRDQERRILEARPRQISEAGSKWKKGRPGVAGTCCGSCGGGLASWNTSGFCSRTADCRAALQRDWSKRNPDARAAIKVREKLAAVRAKRQG